MNIQKTLQKIKAFTLVELITAVALIIILAVISVPIYKSNSQKAKETEAYSLLSSIRTAQYAYYKEYGYFLYSNSWIDNSPALGVDARGNKYYRSFQANINNGANKNYYFLAYVKDIENNTFLIQYNVTKGSRIDKTVNNSWA